MRALGPWRCKRRGDFRKRFLTPSGTSTGAGTIGGTARRFRKAGFENLETIQKSLPKEKWPQELRIRRACRALLQSPKRRIGLHQFESRVPRFMAAPDD